MKLTKPEMPHVWINITRRGEKGELQNFYETDSAEFETFAKNVILDSGLCSIFDSGLRTTVIIRDYHNKIGTTFSFVGPSPKDTMELLKSKI